MNGHFGTSLFLMAGVLILVVGAQAQFPCQPEQIHWSNTTGKRYKCLDCPDCPAGSQPSVPCGSTVKYGTAVHCVGCEPGKTFSEKYNKAQCDACTVCSEGKSVLKNCNLSSNTKCSSQCASGFYLASFLFKCLPCSECCNDGNDEVAVECANQKKKCKVRATSCAKIQTTATQLVTGEQSTQSKQSEKADVSTPVFGDLTTPFWPSATTNTAVTTLKPDKNGSLLTLVVVSGVVVLVICLLPLIFAVVRFKSVRKLLKSCWRSRSADLGSLRWLKCRPICRSKDIESGVYESTVVEEIVTYRGVLLPLKKLRSVSLDSYDKVCKRLDRKLGKGCYEEVARVFKFEEEDIWELEKGFRNCDSPSRLLLECLETKNPRLTVFEFIKVLEGPEVLRNDIVIILKEYIYETQTISPITYKDVHV